MNKGFTGLERHEAAELNLFYTCYKGWVRLNFIDSGSDSAYRFWFLSIPNSDSNKIKR